MNNPLVQPDPGLYIWTILTFLVLLALLTKFAWKPLLEALENRQQAIRKALDDARQAKQELEGIHAESAKLLAQARSEAAEIVSRSRSDADRFREEMKEKARAEAAALMRNAERSIELETTRALQQIRHEAVDISVGIAAKLLQRNVSREDNERLIEETFKQLESTRGAAAGTRAHQAPLPPAHDSRRPRRGGAFCVRRPARGRCRHRRGRAARRVGACVHPGDRRPSFRHPR
jgi:F-type H+-transporting ATPase subunit b